MPGRIGRRWMSGSPGKCEQYFISENQGGMGFRQVNTLQEIMKIREKILELANPMNWWASITGVCRHLNECPLSIRKTYLCSTQFNTNRILQPNPKIHKKTALKDGE